MITIVVVDDHEIVRQGLISLLQQEPDFKVVGDTGDSKEAIRLCKQLQPNVLLVDVSMPEFNGLDITRQVTRTLPETRVVVLSMYDYEAYVQEALAGGAHAYVLKQASPTELARAIREAVAGRRYLSSPLSEAEIEAYAQRTLEAPLSPMDKLTSRERQILNLVVANFSNNEIAAQLKISPRTVERHRFNLMRKLELRNRKELLRFALDHRLIR